MRRIRRPADAYPHGEPRLSNAVNERAEDRALVERMLAGDDRAFDAFAEAYFSLLYRFALRRLGGDEETAADIVQSTLTAAMNKLDTFRGEAALSTWLCSICRFEISGLRRRQGRRPTEVELSDDVPEVRAALVSAAAHRDGPADLLVRGETARLVHQTLDELQPRYGRALEWKYIDGLSVREIAARLGLTPKAAESTLTRARIAFADRFVAHSKRGGLLHWPAARSVDS